MQLIRCDKCGCIRQPDSTKTLVVIPHKQYYDNGMTYITLEDEQIPIKISKDLCNNCWTAIMKKINEAIASSK